MDNSYDFIHDKFSVVAELGGGYFSKVFQTRCGFAVKVVDQREQFKFVQRADSSMDSDQEHFILKSLTHPNVITLHDSFILS